MKAPPMSEIFALARQCHPPRSDDGFPFLRGPEILKFYARVAANVSPRTPGRRASDVDQSASVALLCTEFKSLMVEMQAVIADLSATNAKLHHELIHAQNALELTNQLLNRERGFAAATSETITA